jgi:hypothetical protein
MQPMQDAKGFFASLVDFSFSSLITTKIIKFVYVIIMVVVSLFALFFLIASLTRGVVGAFLGIIFAPLGWLLYMILARIYLEIVIIIFRIGEDVRLIATRGGPTPGGYAPPPTPGGYPPPPTPGAYPPPPTPGGYPPPQP